MRILGEEQVRKFLPFSKGEKNLFSFLFSEKNIIYYLQLVSQKLHLLVEFKHPKLWVAAIVVSEITERLSPNIAPESKAAPINPNGEPLFSAKSITMGPKVTIEPTEVPEAKDKNEAITKIPTGKYAAEI